MKIYSIDRWITLILAKKKNLNIKEEEENDFHFDKRFEEEKDN